MLAVLASLAIAFAISDAASGAAAGGILWTRQFGTASFDLAHALAADATGLYVAGFTNGALPGQTNAGGYDAFVEKYDAIGNLVWTREFGTVGDEYVTALAADATGVYVAGETNGALPGQTNAGSYDAFVGKYDAGGNLVWTREFGTVGFDDSRALAADATGLYVAGFTNGALPGQTNAGSLDAFLARVAEIPGIPVGLQAAPGDGRVGLAWDPPAFDGHAPLASYRIYRGTDPGSLQLVAVLDAGVQRYVDVDVQDGVTYYYAIAAANAIGEGPPSVPVSATPQAQTGMQDQLNGIAASLNLIALALGGLAVAALALGAFQAVQIRRLRHRLREPPTGEPRGSTPP